MQLTNEEQAQIARIKEKIPRIAALDPECKLFGSEGWKYQWPKPAREAKIASWEKKTWRHFAMGISNFSSLYR